MQWFLMVGIWYLVLLFLGLVFFPITKKFFKSFYDYGYPFAKTVGIILVSYSIFVLSTYKVLEFSHLSLLLIIGIFAFINYRFFFPHKVFQGNRWIFLIIEEAVFLIALLFWAYIRSHEPSIHGLEKFMDFGFMNSVNRGSQLPAKDMWLAGSNINYYYFGHITGGILTKLSMLPGNITYNLILATLFALGITQTFSLGLHLGYIGFKKNLKLSVITGVLSSFIVNLGGNLHPIYALTKGYPNETPVPFWTLPAKYSIAKIFQIKEFFDRLPEGYWYPNATRFIPFTIHEFPLYSYVVADLHGHVFDIPFVLLTLTVLFVIFTEMKAKKPSLIYPVILGFLTSIHFMTNAFDGPIYLLLATVVLFFAYKSISQFVIGLSVMVLAFVFFNIPFSLNFEPFSSALGINCAPDFLVKMGKIGPLLFEKGNCQQSPLWMMAILWGFFLFNFLFLLIKTLFSRGKKELSSATSFSLILFAVSTLLIIVPEFLYAKDIYPAHFRANTMFKLGYQAFIMMGVASAYTFTLFKRDFGKSPIMTIIYLILFLPLFFLIALYPTFAIDSYYGGDGKQVTLDGSLWINDKYPEYKEIIDYLNANVKGQPVILEAQGDSYTDYDVVSSYTGLPTVAGWAVHEWLWRGTYDIVGAVIPDVQTIYESDDPEKVSQILKKYRVEYVIVGSNEKEKYKNLVTQQFEALGRSVFQSTNKAGTIYKIGY
ncbi:hypothetical protein A3F34_00420 [Candidatus Roizmanbacteria bacterium RIFCSPHIGHO2_12_FULL_44_10]|uniref:YYY membrane protein n=1 Tax=Candidatus Roizmanbacteria bacterium RIFCSPHIGHO2_12_FULL_44_10 TaxID=1802054 RepID=A0A1F7I755_9BACT|nr:MAG: hypothetical protein A3F34_00420 [Candidatus Roizmanbacteria bacterium RIFCSPHIGHO2_12_FULL_44_10]